MKHGYLHQRVLVLWTQHDLRHLCKTQHKLRMREAAEAQRTSRRLWRAMAKWQNTSQKLFDLWQRESDPGSRQVCKLAWLHSLDLLRRAAEHAS